LAETEKLIVNASPVEDKGAMSENKKGGSSGWRAFWILMVLVLIALALIIWQWDEISRRLCQPLAEEMDANCREKIASLKHPIPAQPQPLAQEIAPEQVRKWAELTGSYPKWPDDLLAPKDCVEVEEDLKAICSELDRRPYLAGQLPQGGSFELLKMALRDLSSVVPVASAEMRRPDAVLANVFHFYRVLGPRRVSLINEIMANEEALSEPMAMALYRWVAAQDKCNPQAPAISRGTFLDYAAFLLNTMGGQGYLRRRSPKIASLATFYALVALDSAAKEGSNPHGLDLTPHISFCRSLLSRQDLVFRDRYLQILEEMGERWKGLGRKEREGLQRRGP